MGIEIGKEWEAYRSIIEESRAGYDSVNTLRGPLHGIARILTRLVSEVEGAILYPIERLKDGDSPETILQHSQEEIAVWRRMR